MLTRRLHCLLPVLAALAGCPKSKPPPPRALQVSKPIDVVDRSLPRGQVAAELVQGWVQAQIRKASALRLVQQASPKAYHLRVEYGLGPQGDETVAMVTVRGERTGQVDVMALQASVLRRGSQVGRHELQQAVERAMRDVAYQARLTLARAAEVVSELRTQRDPHRLAAAVDIAAVRRLKPALPVLITLLKHKDESVADRAIGALVAIGDRRAVRPLTRLSKFSDTEKMAKLLDAIGTLGGAEAKSYLEFVASGHDDADIRNMAREALQRAARQASPSPRPETPRRK